MDKGYPSDICILSVSERSNSATVISITAGAELNRKQKKDSLKPTLADSIKEFESENLDPMENPLYPSFFLRPLGL